MALPLPPGQHIVISHGLFREHFEMDSMEVATDHYNIGITLQGHRRTITPLYSYSYKPGDVAVAPPFLLHRTVSESDGPYERIMIKFSPKFVEPFIKDVGQSVFHRLYENLVYHFTEDTQEKIRRMFFDMLEEYEKNTPYRDFILQGMLFRLFITVLEEHLPTRTVTHPSSLTPPIMNAIAYMETHYKSQPSIEEVAQYAGFSTGYFSRLFHAQSGLTYSAYLNNIQIRHVQILLSTTDMSVTDIAQETGYCHSDYLSAQFKKKTGMTPSEYRRKAKSYPQQPLPHRIS